MKTTYITFSKEMAIAYRMGFKTMTRRVVVPQPRHDIPGASWVFDGTHWCYPDVCPIIKIKPKYGMPGDKLILGTTWAVNKVFDDVKPTELPHFDGEGLHDCLPIDIWSYFESDEKPDYFDKLRPARFLPGFFRHRMPQETLTTARIERLQDITEHDAIREGIFETPRDPGFESWSTYGMREYYATPRRAFRALWDKINAKRGYPWASNPWVWPLGWGK
jgi:hypothetical protein